MSSTPALLLAAGGVGFGHAILPDHWVPLAVIGRTRRYPLARVMRLSGLAGVAHVGVSVLLGGVIIAVGLQFRSTVEHAQDTIIGSLLILTGIGFAALELTGRGHSHDHSHGHHHHGDHAHDHHGDHAHDQYDHDHHRHHHDHDPHSHEPHDPARRPGSRLSSLAAVMVPFGAAASPDLTILPVFLAATAAGTATALASLLVFGTVTIATIVVLTLLATASGYQVTAGWLDRFGNVLTAGVLVVIGTLVLVGVL